MTLQLSLKLRLMEKRFFICDCGCGKHIEHPNLAHILIHDQKRFHEFLTNEINCGIVSQAHHDLTNSYEFRVKFYEVQVKRYGRKAVIDYFKEAKKLGLVVEDWLLNGGER